MSLSYLFCDFIDHSDLGAIPSERERIQSIQKFLHHPK